MRAVRPRRWVHYTLLGCLLVEILELELVADGFPHHAWDAVVVVVYACAAGGISKRGGVAAVMLFLGGTPWTVDLLGVQWEGADIESFLWALTHATLAVILAHRVFWVEEVSAVEIVDAVSLYIVVAIAFANLYSMILWHHPGALAHVSVPAGERPSYDLVLYYSFVSQLTVGYGDIAPAHPVTRTMSIVQALFGVMYIAILISWFVSLLSASHLNRNRRGK